MPIVKRALLSVWDKTGLIEFARGLVARDIQLLSTGGTFRALEEAGIAVTKVADVTGFPEILDGRVKTLHPAIHGGILANRELDSHTEALAEHGIGAIDLVAVNLYPFRDAAATPGKSAAEVIEMIDIGGPTMVRAAAKNHRGVVVVVDPGDYPRVLKALEQGNGDVALEIREQLALEAFRHTQSYDAAIARWMSRRENEAGLPGNLVLELDRAFEPRYGENPHQAAAVYVDRAGGGLLGGFEQIQGKQLSYNNMLDSDAARRLAASFSEPVVAIIKHSNPCGVGVGATPAEAYERALACDPVSAFGSIVATNREADDAFAEALKSLFVEVVLAPSYSEGALAILAAKKNLRILTCPIEEPRSLELRGIDGGFIAQQPDTVTDDHDAWECVTRRQPSDEEQAALRLAWTVSRHVKSNAIVVANAHQTVGIGAGQMSRVDSCRIAIDKAELPLDGTVAASDAFFPFADGLETLAEAGIKAVVEPGGSKRDVEVIEAADRHGVAMLFTGRRHFRH